MKQRKVPPVMGWFMVIVLLLAFCSNSPDQSSVGPINTPPQSVMEGGDSKISGQEFDEYITVDGVTFAPQITNTLPPELTDGSQWLLVYWWENHEINSEGLGIDWGFFCPVGITCTVPMMAKCHDPTAPNPTPGVSVYTYYATEGLLKVPGDTAGLQRFVPYGGVSNPSAPTALPTATTQPAATPGSTESSQQVLTTEDRKGSSLFDQLCGIGAIGLLITLIILGNRFLNRFRKE